MADFELKKSKVIDVLYTGGDCQLTRDGATLFSTCNGVVKVTDLNSGTEKFTIGDPEDPARVTSFCLYYKAGELEIVIGYTSDVLKRFRIRDSGAVLMRQFRSTHTAPVLLIRISDDCSKLATGSADSSVKLWDMDQQFCTHTLKGPCVVTAVTFVDNDRLAVGYSDGQARLYNVDIKGGEKLRDFLAHSSAVTAILRITDKTETVAILSRDQTLSIFEIDIPKALRILPLFEPIESAVYIPLIKQICTIGVEGKLKYWDIEKGCIKAEKQLAANELLELSYNEATSTLVCATVEHNLIFVDSKTRRIMKQMSGFNDEVLDAAFVSHELNCIAVATNSPQLKIYDLKTFNCTLVGGGHTGNIMCVAAAKWANDLVATASVDNNCVIWRLTNSDGVIGYEQIAIGSGHTDSVNSIQFSNHRTNPFVVTVSKDLTVKLWTIDPLFKKKMEQGPFKLTANSTFLAHQKDINCVAISSNDRLCVTGSMDKLAKLWHIDPTTMQLGPAGVLSGHKRGVFAAKFSPAEQTVVTTSGDHTIKIFALADLTCQMTLEGHAFAVLTLTFVNNGRELLTGDSNGLLKIWDLKTGVCQKTLEAHEEKIWSVETIEPSAEALENLTTRRRAAITDDPNAHVDLWPEEHIRYITVSTDGRTIVWEDVTEEAAEIRARLEAEELANVQTLENYLRAENYDDALFLTLRLDRPYNCLKVLKAISQKNDDTLGILVKKLTEEQLLKLLEYVAQWNTNTRTYATAQYALNSIFRSVPPKRLQQMPGFDQAVTALLPYTKRHFDRLVQMSQDATFLNYVIQRMSVLGVDNGTDCE